MDAARVEQVTGQRVYGKDHIEKCTQHKNGLGKKLKDPCLSSKDKAITQSLLDDINNMLSGR